MRKAWSLRDFDSSNQPEPGFKVIVLLSSAAVAVDIVTQLVKRLEGVPQQRNSDEYTTQKSGEAIIWCNRRAAPFLRHPPINTRFCHCIITNAIVQRAAKSPCTQLSRENAGRYRGREFSRYFLVLSETAVISLVVGAGAYELPMGARVQ